MDYGLLLFKLKMSQKWICILQTHLQMLTGGLELCGLLRCFYQTLILTAPIHCRASIGEIVMQCYISECTNW